MPLSSGKKTLWAVVILLQGAFIMAEQKKLEVATFAGGCFWCMEPPFENLAPGVTDVVSGYTGGRTRNPTYEEVSTGSTGHIEAVRVTYDPARVSYEKLLEAFWRNIDPTDEHGQFADKGTQYHTAIFYHDEAQRKAAEESKKALAALKKFDRPIVTRILPASDFYPAEDYHQDYHKKNPLHYNRYKTGSGRAGFLKRMWGGESDPH